jgi:hypothetical protein
LLKHRISAKRIYGAVEPQQCVLIVAEAKVGERDSQRPALVPASRTCQFYAELSNNIIGGLVEKPGVIFKRIVRMWSRALRFALALSEILLGLALRFFDAVLDAFAGVAGCLTDISANLPLRLLHLAFSLVLNAACVDVLHNLPLKDWPLKEAVV